MTFKVISAKKKKRNFIAALLMPTDNDNGNDEASER